MSTAQASHSQQGGRLELPSTASYVSGASYSDRRSSRLRFSCHLRTAPVAKATTGGRCTGIAPIIHCGDGCWWNGGGQCPSSIPCNAKSFRLVIGANTYIPTHRATSFTRIPVSFTPHAAFLIQQFAFDGPSCKPTTTAATSPTAAGSEASPSADVQPRTQIAFRSPRGHACLSSSTCTAASSPAIRRSVECDQRVPSRTSVSAISCQYLPIPAHAPIHFNWDAHSCHIPVHTFRKLFKPKRWDGIDGAKRGGP